MQRSKTKALSVILAACMAGGIVAGCQKQDTSSAGSGPKRTLKVEVFDRGKAGQPDLNNNFWTKYINSNFGAKNNCTVEFVSIPRSQEIDKLNILMSSNSAPDLSFTYDSGTLTNFISQNGLAQLDAPVAKYGQTLSKYLGKEVMGFGKFNGKLYTIPGKRTITMTIGTFIRKDWLDKLNLPLPKTRDEFYSDLVAFRDKNPGGVSGVVPMVLSAFGSSNNIGTANMPDSFYTNMDEKEIALTTFNTSYSMSWKREGYKPFMQYLNKLFHEKLVSPDFAIDKTDSLAVAAVSSGKAGVVCGNWDYIYRTSPGIYATLKKNVPSAQIVPVDCFKNAKGKYSKQVYAAYAAFLLVPKSSQNTDLVIKYLNWMADPKVTILLQNGEESKDYTLDGGIPKPVVPSTLVGDKSIGCAFNGDYDMLTNGPELGDDTKNAKMLSFGYPGFEDDVQKAAKIGMTDTYTNYNYAEINAAYAKYGTTLQNMGPQMMAATISCDPSQFSSVYDTQFKNYMDAGAQAVYDENVKNYAAEKKTSSSKAGSK